MDSPQKAVELLAALRSLMGDRLTAFELISRVCLDAVIRFKPATPDPLRGVHAWYVLAEFTDGGSQQSLAERAEAALMECTERGILVDVALAQSEAQANALWAIRETLPEAQFTNVKHDMFVWTATTTGQGGDTTAISSSNVGQGGELMGFYNMAAGDAPYFKQLASTYAISSTPATSSRSTSSATARASR